MLDAHETFLQIIRKIRVESLESFQNLSIYWGNVQVVARMFRAQHLGATRSGGYRIYTQCAQGILPRPQI